jgi:hypothetical protein
MGIATFPPASSASGFSRSALITSSGTWTHPDGASGSSPKPIMIQMSGGGGGGASGCAVANISTGNYFNHGGGGGSSGVVLETYAITTGTLTITIGSGGSGGGSTNTTSTSYNSTSGSPGGTTTIAFPSPFGTLRARGGIGGYGGYAQSSGTVYTSGFCGGTASPQGTELQASTGAGVVGANGMSDGASAHAYARGGSYQGRSNFAGQGDAAQSMTLAGTSTLQEPVDENGNLFEFVKLSSLPAGSGAEGGHTQNNGSTRTPAGGTGGYGTFGRGGNGGAGRHVTSGASTATAGSAPVSGYGGGGGGGGAASTRTANTASSGAGGNGASGAVIIYY